jgi:hypothetical protein
MGYGRSKRVMKVGGFDRRWAFCGEPKSSFSRDHRSTSRFKIVSCSQNVNSLAWTSFQNVPNTISNSNNFESANTLNHDGFRERQGIWIVTNALSPQGRLQEAHEFEI